MVSMLLESEGRARIIPLVFSTFPPIEVVSDLRRLNLEIMLKQLIKPYLFDGSTIKDYYDFFRSRVKHE